MFPWQKKRPLILRSVRLCISRSGAYFSHRAVSYKAQNHLCGRVVGILRVWARNLGVPKADFALYPAPMMTKTLHKRVRRL